MSYPILYETNATDFFNLGLGTLPDAISPLVTEERNGEFVFDMSYPIDGRRADLIKNNRIIKVDAGHLLKDQRFVIKTVTPQMDNSGKIFLMIHAEHVSYLANDLAIKPIVNGLDVNASQALSIWNSNLTTPNQFTVDSDINSKNSFSWSIDKVQNGRQALGGVEGSILDHWHGEYRFDNLHISLLQHRGTIANTLLAYGRNLTTFEQEESILETYTSVYPYALLTPAGGDSESKIYTIDGLIIDSTYAANFPNRKVLPVDFSSQFENVKVGTKPSGDDADKTSTYLSLAQVQSKLKEFAQSYIGTNNVGVPKVSIKVSFVDLANTVNYADVAPLEELDLCDEVPIRFSKLGIDTTAKVSRVVWNVLTDSYDSLELGEISATLGDKLTEIEQTANKAQDTADKANIVQVGADGKSTIFRGSDTPIANHVGDLWYRPNGEYMEMYQWDGVTWHFVMSTKDTHDISDKFDQAMQEMADKVAEIDAANNNSAQALEAANLAKQTSQEAANSVNLALSDIANAKQNASDALASATQANDSIVNIKSDIDTINGKFDLVASKQDINTLEQRVKTNELAIKGNSDALELTAKQSDVNSLTGRVATAENSIKINAKAIEGKASNSTVDELTGELTTAKNEWKTSANGFTADILNVNTSVEKANDAIAANKASIKATSAEFQTSISSVSNKIDDLTIGGRNLLLGTAIRQSIKGTNSTNQVSSATNYTFAQGSFNAWAKTGSYTLSFDWITTDSNPSGTFYFQLYGSPYTGLSPTVTVSKDNKSGHVSLTLNLNVSNIQSQGGIQFRCDGLNGTIALSNVQFEYASKESNWGPAPEELATTSAVSIIDQKADNLQSIVADKASISQFNQLSNQVNIAVSRIDSEKSNLIINGSFVDEHGWAINPSNRWFQVNNISPIASGHYMGATSTNATEEYVIQNLDNSLISRLRSHTVTFSVWAQSTDGLGKLNIYSKYTDSDDKAGYLFGSTVWQLSTVWERHAITIHLPADMKTLNITFQFQNLPVGKNLYLAGAMLTLGDQVLPYSESSSDIVSQINLDSSGVYIQGKHIMLDGQTIISNGIIKSSMIDTLDASKITAGTLNAANVNIINMNVSKLVGDTTNFVQSAWNGISGNIYIDSSSINVIGDWGANTLDSWGIRSYAYNANHNLELVGNFSSTYAVGNKNINGTLVSADYEGDFVGIGYRNKVGDNFTPMVGYFKQDQTALGWYQGTNIIGHLILHDYIKPLGGTGDYIQVGTINFNNIKYAYIGNSSGKAGFAYGSGYMYLISQGSAYRMAGWKIPIDIASDGKVKTWIELPGSAS